MTHPAQILRTKLEVETEFGAFLGDTRIRLLEAIAIHGSISQAAKKVPLSYKAAWDAIDNMNNLAEQPLVLRSAGGRQGGGTQLTAYGKKVVALYRALEAEYQAALDPCITFFKPERRKLLNPAFSEAAAISRALPSSIIILDISGVTFMTS